MESHPIPQQISSYQFRLVGDMTLKQFFQIAGGALVSLLFYSLPIHPLLKWPFVIFFALLGVALAFLPLEDRPLERWILAFFRAIYSPTVFFWQKMASPPVYFQEEAATPAESIIFPGGEEKLKEYLGKTQTDVTAGKLEKSEASFLSNLTGLFTGFLPGIKSVSTPSPTIVQEEVTPQPKKEELAVPVSAAVSVPGKLVVEETTPEGVVTQKVPFSPITPFEGGGMVAQKQAAFSIQATPPNPPTTPNTIVGQVVDNERKIVEGAILEVRDESGRPVRALKSNKLGHFLVVTPLANGKYEIITEKDGFEFEPVSFEAQGGIIPPMAVSGKKLAGFENQPLPARPVPSYIPVKGTYP